MFEVRLPAHEVLHLPTDPQTTISDVIRSIARGQNVDENQIACYHHRELILPFVKLQALRAAKIEVAFLGDRLEPRQPVMKAETRRRPSPAINCFINQRLVTFVIDTGASMSVLYTNQVSQCKVESRLDCSPTSQLCFAGADQGVLRTLGVVHDVELRIGSITTKQTFAIMPGVCQYGLLGMDWLCANNAVIDPVHNRMFIGTKVIQFNFW
jgi:hypothetical protein